jgi:hypothetical protein
MSCAAANCIALSQEECGCGDTKRTRLRGSERESPWISEGSRWVVLRPGVGFVYLVRLRQPDHGRRGRSIAPVHR